MNRRYTRELYLEKIDKLRHRCPDIAISSDFIVGFPGETPGDFRESLDLIQEVGFDSLFAFMYSDRPSAPANRFPEKVPERVKGERLQELLDLQESCNAAKSAAMIGSIQEVLIDGFSKKQGQDSAGSLDEVQWTGRTSGNRIVNFVCDESDNSLQPIRSGDLAEIRIEKAFSHSLWGKPLETTGAVLN